MDPNSSTPMEGSTRVHDIIANISDQDSDSGGEVTSGCSSDSDQCEFGPILSLPLFRYQFMKCDIDHSFAIMNKKEYLGIMVCWLMRTKLTMKDYY